MKIAHLIIGSVAVLGCDKGWQQDPTGNCLKRSRTPETWPDAQNDCIRSDAHLIHIGNAEYNDMVSSMNTESDMWIGYESPRHTTSFYDSDGRSAVYSNWGDKMDGRSTNSQSTECAYIESGKSGEWNSQSCYQKLPYVCQRNARIVGNELTDSTFEALMTCHDWINQALTCRKPFDKISKYEFRFTKVAKATLKAVSIEGSGNNSDTEEDRMLARLSSRQSKKVEAQLAKAEQLCRSTMSSVWEREEFVQCPKLGSWKRRMNGLQDAVGRMMNICLKREKYY